MKLIRDPQGDRLAQIVFHLGDVPRSSLVLTDIPLTEVTRTGVPGYYRLGGDIFLRVRVVIEPG